MYGIITTEKEFMRSWIFDFLTAFWSHRKGLDHTFDHLRLRTVWKQCLQEHPKAPISDSKAPKSLVNQAKNQLFSVWEHDVAGSNPVIPTISSVHNTSELWTLDFFLPMFTFSSIFSLIFDFLSRFSALFCFSFCFHFSFFTCLISLSEDTLSPRLVLNQVYRYALE